MRLHYTRLHVYVFMLKMGMLNTSILHEIVTNIFDFELYRLIDYRSKELEYLTIAQ